MSGCEITEKAQINKTMLQVCLIVQHFWYYIISGLVVNREERVVDLW